MHQSVVLPTLLTAKSLSESLYLALRKKFKRDTLPMIGSFGFRMHPRNMPTLVFKIFSHVGTKCAFVHVAIIFGVATQMSL